MGFLPAYGAGARRPAYRTGRLLRNDILELCNSLYRQVLKFLELPLSNGTKDIHIQSAEYPVTLRVEGGNLSIRDRVGGDLINTVVKDGQSIVITNPALESFQVNTIDLPTAFKLDQNYPNPFNPTTTINYSVPKTSFVIIKVYDVLGNEVKTLVNEEKKAGNYRTQLTTVSKQWASGVYFYRMSAGGFTETKKLILMK
ncbi:MAG: T9SS type A sorting domain-containing protein [Ignavibacteriaceae bacterium]